MWWKRYRYHPNVSDLPRNKLESEFNRSILQLNTFSRYQQRMLRETNENNIDAMEAKFNKLISRYYKISSGYKNIHRALLNAQEKLMTLKWDATYQSIIPCDSLLVAPFNNSAIRTIYNDIDALIENTEIQTDKHDLQFCLALLSGDSKIIAVRMDSLTSTFSQLCMDAEDELDNLIEETEKMIAKIQEMLRIKMQPTPEELEIMIKMYSRRKNRLLNEIEDYFDSPRRPDLTKSSDLRKATLESQLEDLYEIMDNLKRKRSEIEINLGKVTKQFENDQKRIEEIQRIKGIAEGTDENYIIMEALKISPTPDRLEESWKSAKDYMELLENRYQTLEKRVKVLEKQDKAFQLQIEATVKFIEASRNVETMEEEDEIEIPQSPKI